MEKYHGFFGYLYYYLIVLPKKYFYASICPSIFPKK